MEGVEEIRQIDDTHTHWTHEDRRPREGVRRGRSPSRRPDERIAWTSEDGPEHAGVVTFHHLDDTKTRVMLQLDYEPEGPVEKAGDLLGVVERRVKGDLERFKELIESRGVQSAGWRGEVDQTTTR